MGLGMSARMGAIVHLPEVLRRYGRVFLCRREARVPEQLLDFTQVRPHVEQVRRITVSDTVRMNAILDAHREPPLGMPSVGEILEKHESSHR